MSASAGRCQGTMRIETLVVAIGQHDHELVKRMNLQTDSLVGNQCDISSDDCFEYRSLSITYLNRAERGAARNRNMVLERSTADLCVLADDDLSFVDDYPKLVREAFDACPQADILVFNLIEKHPIRKVNTRYRRVRSYNYGPYGAPRLVLRRAAVVGAGLRFNEAFGGGARYSSGEDSIFLHDCIKRGLKIYTAPLALAELDQNSSSTHFTGFNRSFFFNKGAMYTCLHPVMHPLFSLIYVIRHREEHRQHISASKALAYMVEGARDYRRWARGNQ